VQTPLVAVLLSSYNGERYLAEQLDSLLAQTHRNLRIVVRDDGSSDNTREILRRYASEHANVQVTYGENIGLVPSFFRLVDEAPSADYYCFSDQDDVWEADKVERGMHRLRAVTGPALYFTDVQVVDSALRPLGYEHNPAPRGASFENALVQNIATGCTMMLNAAAHAALRRRPLRLVSYVYHHDWWVYAVIAGIGQVLYDPYPSIKYRQHGTNVTGSPYGLRRWTAKVKRHLGPATLRIRRQAEELLRIYGDELPPERKRLLEEFVHCMQSGSWIQRARYAMKSPLFRQDGIDTAFLKMLMAAGRV